MSRPPRPSASRVSTNSSFDASQVPSTLEKGARTRKHALGKYVFHLGFARLLQASIRLTFTALTDPDFAVDLGAEDLAARIASDTKLPVLCSRVSRLVVDVNRPVTSDTIFRPLADGNPVLLNAKLSAEEKQDRIDRYWKPYRFELNEILINNPSIELVISVHSFTSNYEGDHRDCEIGILYLDSVKEASWFIKDFEEKGYKVVENEPWPATLCDIAAPVMAAGKQIVILEIRNDLASDPEFRRRIAADIQGLLEKEKLL